MIKYIDKIQNLENKIFYSYDFRLACTSLDELIDKIKISENYEEMKYNKMSFIIDIINTDNTPSKYLDSYISKDLMIDIYEAKSIITDLSYRHKISISSNLDEIYVEAMEVLLNKFDKDIKCFMFDYGLMYGGKTFYEDKYVNFRYPYTGYMYITDTFYLNKKFKIINLKDGVNFMYYGDIYDEFMNCTGSSALPAGFMNKMIDSKEIPYFNNSISYIKGVKIGNYPFDGPNTRKESNRLNECKKYSRSMTGFGYLNTIMQNIYNEDGGIKYF